MLKKILITDNTDILLQKGLENLGFEVGTRPNITADELWDSLPQYFGLIVGGKIPFGRAFFERGKKLAFVGRLGSGLEIFDLSAAAEFGVTVINSPEGNANAVAEHALGQLLALMRHLRRADMEVRTHTWLREANRGTEVAAQTVGIVGFGNTGRAFARLLQGFGCRVLAYDAFCNHFSDTFGAELCSLSKLKAEATVLSFHIPQAPENENFFDLNFLEEMEKPFFLLNTSRGAVCCRRAIAEGLNTRKIHAAALDVLPQEPPVADDLHQQLLSFDNIIFSPHIAGWTIEAKHKMAAVLLEKITTTLNLK